MRMSLLLAFVSFTIGCADVDDGSQTEMSDEEVSGYADAAARVGNGQLPDLPDNLEYVFHDNRVHVMWFPGYFSSAAETFFIWNLGTTIQHDATYPSPSHDNLYAVFAPGPGGSTHHVDGQDAFDHYHIVSHATGIRTYDVWLVFPGPNYDAATYTPVRTEAAMNAQIAAGILAAPITTTAAGFDQLVIRVPVL
jgi:hypothetical protein